MGKRGRPSAAEESTPEADPLEAIKRPEPPEDLFEDQALIWRTIVNQMPADWFPAETHGLLAQYCIHKTRLVTVNKQIRALEAQDPINLKDARDWMKMEKEQTQLLSMLATKMRMAQQSTYDKSKRKKHAAENPF